MALDHWLCLSQPNCLLSMAFVHRARVEGCDTKPAVAQQELPLPLSKKVFPAPTLVVQRPEKVRDGSGLGLLVAMG